MSKKIIFILVIMIIAVIFVIGLRAYLQKSKSSMVGTENASPQSAAVAPTPQKVDNGRYFLAKVVLVNKNYQPSLFACLQAKGAPKIVQDSFVYWPSIDNPQMSLARIEFTDPQNSVLDKSCYLKGIVSDADWQDVQNKYRFSKTQFGF